MRNRVVAGRLRCGNRPVLATVLVVLVGCSQTPPPSTTAVVTSTAEMVTADRRGGATMPDEPTVAAAGAQPQLPPEPVQVADDLVADENTLPAWHVRAPAPPEELLGY